MPWYFHHTSAGVYIFVPYMSALVTGYQRDCVLFVFWCGCAVESLGPCDASLAIAGHRDFL
jgi:hypothetical protein